MTVFTWVRQMHFIPGALAFLRDKVEVQVQVRVMVVKRVEAHVDAVGASHGTDSEITTLVAADVDRVSEAIAAIAGPEAQILRWRSFQPRVGTILLAIHTALGVHAYKGLVYITFQDNLPRMLRRVDITVVDTLDRHGVDHRAHLPDKGDQTSLRRRRPADANAHDEHQALGNVGNLGTLLETKHIVTLFKICDCSHSTIRVIMRKSLHFPERLGFLGNQPFSTRLFCANSSPMPQRAEAPNTPRNEDR